VIEFRKVTVRYPRRDAEALSGVSLTAAPGTLTAVVGPNGSGKSTLVRALVGRVSPSSGSIFVDDRPVDSYSGRRELATRVAVVVQREEPAFPLRVREYVALGRYPHLGLLRAPSRQDRTSVDEALSRTATTHLADRLITELSGGEWQRVRLARAVAQGADAIVLDEPTTFLDVGHEMGVFELMSRLAREGHAVLLVSHQLNLVARFADRIILLHRGQVASSGTPSEVMQGAVLERVYEWPLVITRDPAVGAPALVPLRSPARD
jgi:iron complex transport system ATP-binding protein